MALDSSAPSLPRFDLTQRPLVEHERFTVHWFQGLPSQALAEALGAARERTFQAVGEGTGKRLDLDRFDPYYEHLVLVDRDGDRLAGAYRLAPITPTTPLRQRYLSTLFHFPNADGEALADALELGRSFIFPTYQRDPAALFLLWKGIGQCLQYHGVRYLLGPVSVSQDYGVRGQALIAEWLTQQTEGPMVSGRTPLPEAAQSWARAQLAPGAGLRDVENLLTDQGKGAQPGGATGKVPVLLRHYLGLGATALGFNVDHGFGASLDVLMKVDITRLRPAVARRYLGAGPELGLGRAA
jgi:putative hemolysin